MKRLVIIGAGGMGRTVYDIARECEGYGETFEIKGFIDDNLLALEGKRNYPPVLGNIVSYEIEEGDVFISSIGGEAKMKCVASIKERGGEFITLIHKTARIGTNVEIGVGNLIAAYVTIGSEAKIGDYNMIQSYTIIAHDSIIGNNNRIDTHVVCVGGVEICNNTNIHTSAVLNHKVVIEDNSTVGALSFVIRKVKAGTTVIGNPAKKLI